MPAARASAILISAERLLNYTPRLTHRGYSEPATNQPVAGGAGPGPAPKAPARGSPARPRRWRGRRHGLPALSEPLLDGSRGWSINWVSVISGGSLRLWRQGHSNTQVIVALTKSEKAHARGHLTARVRFFRFR